jgi:hypothetical protein
MRIQISGGKLGINLGGDGKRNLSGSSAGAMAVTTLNYYVVVLQMVL